MYSRKIKVNKKKTKSEYGSNWGPRLALYEREREQASLHKPPPPPPPSSSQYHHQFNHQVVVGLAPGSSSSTSVTNSATYGHHYGQNKSQNQQQLYNHYQQHRQPQKQQEEQEATQNGRRSNDDPGPGYHGNGNGGGSGSDNYYGFGSSHQQQQVRRESTSKLSSGSGSANTTTTTTATTSSSNLSKPLSVIIPPPDRFNLSSSVDFGPDRDSSVPSTKTWRSSPDQMDHDEEDHHHHQVDDDDDNVVDDMDEPTYDHRSGSKKTGSNGINPPPPPPPEFNVKSSSQNNNNRKKTTASSSSSIYEQEKYPKLQTNKNKMEPLGVSSKSSHYHQQNLKSRSLAPQPPPTTTTTTGLGNSSRGGALNKKNDKSTTNGTTVTQEGEKISAPADCLEKDESERMTKSKVNGSTIAALAQLTMVYVPMEAASRNLRNKSRPPPPPAPPVPPLPPQSAMRRTTTKSPEQQAIENLQAKIDETNRNCGGSGSSHIVNLQNQQQQQKNNDNNNTMDESKDPDVDSLLESFDSIIFKPKTILNGHHHQSSSSSGSGSSKATNDNINLYDDNKDCEKLYTTNNGIMPPSSSRRKQQISESPPPLPPPNGSKPLKKGGTNRPDKNLRFSEQLENFQQNSFEKVKSSEPHTHRLGKKVSIPSTPHSEIIHHNGNGHGQHQQQQDTQSISTDIMDLKKCHHNNNNSSEQSFHSTILSCGHMRTSSSYSTLSSITSTLTGEEDENEGGGGGGGGLCDERENCGRRPQQKQQRDPRTALEQLRDLSLLIGGNFSSSSTPNNLIHENDNHHNDIKNKNKKKNKILKKDTTTTTTISNNNNIKKTRRDSEGSSGIDSGQGSGQSPTDESPTQGKSNGSYPSSCAFSSKGEECEDHCFMTVFKNPLVADSSSGGSSCHSTSPAHSDRHHHHRHLIIHDQSRSSKHSSSSSSALGKSRAIGGGGGSNGSINNKHHNNGPKKSSSKKSKKSKKSHHHDDLVLEYCDCSQCDCEASRRDSSAAIITTGNKISQENYHQISTKIKSPNHELMNGTNHHHQHHHGSENNSSSSSGGASTNINNNHSNNNRPVKTISSGSSSSSSAVENHQLVHNPNPNNNNNGNNLFTIDEEEVGDVAADKTTTNTIITTTGTNPTNNFMDVTIKDFNKDEAGAGKDHWHPKCWLASDPNMGWSDLESLYSQNLKLDKPININDECWTCWKDVAENRRNATDPNRTVDRTKRMFIWLNKRHQEFNAPWWEAKKQASIRWLVTKAFAHLPKESIGDPFKESKKGKPKYRLKDEVIKGLVNGKLYCMALDHLYQNQQQYRTRGLTHWDIIKILSRKNIYVAQPSDMKLTEGTLRQKKPLRIAAHVALMEAIMGLYCKEILNRDRIVATLHSFGHKIDPETNASAEQLLISWINAAMLTLKSYILSNKNQNQKLPCGRLNRWLNIPQVNEIRDLCDGVGICSLFALYCSNDLEVSEIAVPEPDELLNIYETIANHSLIEKLCTELFEETVYHFCITDFLYIHGYMKQNILAFLVDLFNHLEINPIVRVNRLTHVPIRIEL